MYLCVHACVRGETHKGSVEKTVCACMKDRQKGFADIAVTIAIESCHLRTYILPMWEAEVVGGRIHCGEGDCRYPLEREWGHGRMNSFPSISTLPH